MTISDYYNFIDSFAPFKAAFDYDNAGILVGLGDKKVKKIGIVLDITPEAVEFAAKNQIDLIISHHPVIFTPLKSINECNVAYHLVSRGIAAICAHTNLDCAVGGVNDALAEKLGLVDIMPYYVPGKENEPALGRTGTLTCGPLSPENFARYVKDKLSADGIKYTVGRNNIQKIALCGGSAGEFISLMPLLGVDAFVTGELKHHQLLLARQIGITAVDGGHFETENPVVEYLYNRFTDEFPGENITIIPQSSPTLICK